MIRSLLLAALLFPAAFVVRAADNKVEIASPDGQVALSLRTGDRLFGSITFHGEPVVALSALGITVDGDDLGQNTTLTATSSASDVNEHYITRGVHTNAINHYRTTTLSLTGGKAATAWQLEVRVFNDGVAYRYHVPGTGTRRINGESSSWMLPVGTIIWHQSADNRSYEALYVPDIVGQMGVHHRLMAPATVKFPNGAGYGLITEANLIDYSDMALYSSGTNGFRAVFHDAPDGWEHTGDIVSPWRVTMLAPDLNALVNSDLIKNLCPPPSASLANADWIKPGRSIWHWLTGGGPKLNEQTNWIDGTQAIGYEYYLVDDGWRDWNGGGENAWSALANLVQYAQAHNVKLWAWVNAKYVRTPEDRKEYFRRAKAIGLVGLKVDFPEPANPEWVQWYDDVLRDAAAVELMIDFHGAVKPTGRERTWPNEMTREGICGREQGKNPATHDTALPFLRFVQGHADYTPTLFVPDRLKGSSLAHELAMAIVFTSPYLCLGDHPDRYLKSDAADVMKAMPSVWDETIVLPGSEIGVQAGFARRHGNDWFIGVIGGQMPRRETLPLKFLGAGNYKLVELADDPETNQNFSRSERTVTAADTLTLPLRKDGGYVAWLKKMD